MRLQGKGQTKWEDCVMRDQRCEKGRGGLKMEGKSGSGGFEPQRPISWYMGRK